jgi:hypothetical protein
MKDATTDLLKRFERDYEVYVDATDALTYWIVYARVPKGQEKGIHHMHHGRKYVSGPNQDGNVLILPDPSVSDAYIVESWGPMATFDDFVKKALASILATKKAEDAGLEGGCGSSCG